MLASKTMTEKQPNSCSKIIIRLVLQSPRSSQILFNKVQTEILEATTSMLGGHRMFTSSGLLRLLRESLQKVCLQKVFLKELVFVTVFFYFETCQNLNENRVLSLLTPHTHLRFLAVITRVWTIIN